MSNFGAKLEILFEKYKLTAAEVARSTGINDALISRWINNRQLFVSHPDLERLTAIFKDPHDQASLIRAHLLDECVGHGSQFIDVQIIGGDTIRETTTPYRVIPTLKIQRALDILARESITDADVRSILLSTAALCERPNSNDLAADAADAMDRQILRDSARADAPRSAKPKV